MYRSIARPAVALGALALLAACGQKVDNSTAATTTADNATAPATTPPPTPAMAAPDFVQKAASSDMFEIQAAQLALKRSKNKDVKDFAHMMITDHSKSTADLKAAIASSSLNVTPPAALPDDLKSKLDALTAAQASDFDKTYMDQQVDAHQNALDLMQQYANNGDTPGLKTFASNVAPVVQGHLDKARALQGNLASAPGAGATSSPAAK